MILTKVTLENMHSFHKLSPEGLLTEDILRGKLLIGALSEEGRVSPAGLIIFDLQSPYLIKKPVEKPQMRLIWLYVDERWRGIGIGKALLERLITMGKESGLNEICTSFPKEVPAPPLKAFLEHFGFSFSDSEEINIQVPAHKIAETELCRSARNGPAKGLNEISFSELETFFDRCGIDKVSLYTELSDKNNLYLSSGLVHKGTLSGILLVSLAEPESTKRILNLPLIRVLPKTAPLEICSMISLSLNRIIELYGRQTPIRIVTHNPVTVNLVHYFSPDCPSRIIEAGCRPLP